MTQERHFSKELFSRINPQVYGPLSPKPRCSVAAANDRELCPQTGRALTPGPRRALIKSLNPPGRVFFSRKPSLQGY